MAKYTVVLAKRAVKQSDKLEGDVAELIFESIQNQLTIHAHLAAKKLKGRDGYRIRSGNCRIIYEISDKELLTDVIEVGNRKDIYDWYRNVLVSKMYKKAAPSI